MTDDDVVKLASRFLPGSDFFFYHFAEGGKESRFKLFNFFLFLQRF